MDFNSPEATYPVTMEELLKLVIDKNGSDLHIVAGASPGIRINGDIIYTEYPPAKPGDVEQLLFSVISDYQKERLIEEWELDFSYSVAGYGRFRGNIMRQRGSYAAVFRAVPYVVPEFDKLGLPPAIKNLCSFSRGLILVTGPTGSGKSTTLASMIDIINNIRRCNIVTIEDPIEFLHRHKLSTIRQREIGTDTHSFAAALKHVLRHDPDIILIGEMRDMESISIALTAAETGHLVLSTLHTQTAPLTVSRIVDVFSENRKAQIRQQLANSLIAVISQQLIPTMDRKGRIVAVEYMVNTPAVRNLIREGKEHQLYNAIMTGQSFGMQAMDSTLAALYKEGKISKDILFEYCIDKSEAERLIRNQNNFSGLF